MKKTDLPAIQMQLKLHNQLKNWMKIAFVITSVLAMTFYLSFKTLFFIRVIAGFLFGVSLIAFLIIGYALWRSQSDLNRKLA